jgi:putative transposase
MTLPPDDADFSNRWRIIKRRFTDATASRANGRAPWQSRFWEHTIRDDRDFAAHVDYAHFNPVKHGLASRVRDWPYSSFHRYVRQGILPADWAGDHSSDSADFGERKP